MPTRLFRKWRLGQKDKNNGLLFLIAPTEHRTRFEVGYGLEGTLTDALTKLILRNAVTPKFKANDFPGGIKAGVHRGHRRSDDRQDGAGRSVRRLNETRGPADERGDGLADRAGRVSSFSC